MKAYFWMAALAALVVSQLAVLGPIVRAALEYNFLFLIAIMLGYMIVTNFVLDKVLLEWGDEEELD